MKRFLASMMVFVLLIMAVGCSSAPGSKETSTGAKDAAVGTGSGNPPGSELKYYPTYDSEYKTARNDIFDFWFDIPNGWKAFNKTETGEESVVDSGNGKISLTVYGSEIKGGEDDFYKELSGSNGTVEDFTFRDGWMGKKVTNGSKLYYLRVDGDTYIIFFADYEADQDWFAENRDTIEYIGASLRIRQESFGSMGGENSITLDDLQLGDIKLDMTYEKLLNVMKSKPESENIDEYEGMESKTLFYKDGTEIYLVDGTIYSVNVVSSGYPTPRGLKVGDTAKKLKELYGEPDNVNDETHWGYTFDGYELFSVVLKDGRIAEIQIDLVM